MKLVINLFAGPCAGKSTVAAGVFSRLKLAGINTELVTEYAKDLTWEGNRTLLDNQIHVLGEQVRRIERLRGQVDVVVTDSPIMLGLVYRPPQYPDSYNALLRWFHDQYPNRNFFVTRVKPYQTAGRNQTERQALLLDEKIEDIVRALPNSAAISGNEGGIEYIVKETLGNLVPQQQEIKAYAVHS